MAKDQAEEAAPKWARHANGDTLPIWTIRSTCTSHLKAQPRSHDPHRPVVRTPSSDMTALQHTYDAEYRSPLSSRQAMRPARVKRSGRPHDRFVRLSDHNLIYRG